MLIVLLPIVCEIIIVFSVILFFCGLIGIYTNMLSEKMICLVKKYVIPGIKAHSLYDNIIYLGMFFFYLLFTFYKNEYTAFCLFTWASLFLLFCCCSIRDEKNLLKLIICIFIYGMIIFEYWGLGILQYMDIVFIKREIEQPRIGFISCYMFFVVYVATYAIVYYLEEKIKDNDIIFGLLKKIIWGIFSLWVIGHTLLAFELIDEVFFLDQECRFGQYEDIIKYMYLGLKNMNIVQYVEAYNAIQMKETDTRIIPAWMFIFQYACSFIGLMCLKDVPKYNEEREVYGVSRSLQMCKKEISTFMSIIFCEVICRFINYVRIKTR